MSLFDRRQGHITYGDVYFYTASIYKFQHLLLDDKMKALVIDSLKYLVDNRMADIYGYVIMPNHIHLLWRILKTETRETPVASFHKYTAHMFRRLLASEAHQLDKYIVDKTDREMQFWQRDPLAIPISTETIFIDKLKYIHNNPIRDKWKLCEKPEDYMWSSAGFYDNAIDKYGFLTHYKDA